VRRETFAPGQRDIAYDPRSVDRSNFASIRAPRSAAAGPSTALRAPRSARRGLGSPGQLRLKPAKKPPIFEHDPRAARAGGQRL